MSSTSFSDPNPLVWGEAKKLSWLPVITAVIILVVSSTLIVVGRAWSLPLLGWLLTPFGVVACLGWARFASIKQASDPWFDRADARKKMAILQVLTLFAFLASLPHVWRIGQEAALWLQ